MSSKVPALLAAAALAVQTVPAVAQTESAPTSGARLPGQGGVRSDIFVMLGAIAAAALINVVLIASDDDDEQPVSP